MIVFIAITIYVLIGSMFAGMLIADDKLDGESIVLSSVIWPITLFIGIGIAIAKSNKE